MIYTRVFNTSDSNSNAPAAFPDRTPHAECAGRRFCSCRVRRYCNYRIIILIAGLLIPSIPLQSMASGIDIGGSTWFSWWKPSWNNESAGFTVKPGFYYGPALSFRLPANVTISSGFLYARLKAESPPGPTLAPWATSMETRVIHRYDSDSTISYSFTWFLKLFAGFKYSRIDYENDQRSMIPSVSTIFYFKEKYRYDNYAPALGIGFSVHLIENFFLLITASMLYEHSSIYRKSDMYILGPSLMILPMPRQHCSINKIGANTHLSLAYFIKPISTNIAIGFRYQFFKTVRSAPKYEEYSKYYDHFYGITASVLYRIDFKKKKDQQIDQEQ